MKATKQSPVFITLAELKMLGEFVRHQDLHERIAPQNTQTNLASPIHFSRAYQHPTVI